MNEQEEQNQQDSFIKQQGHKAKDQLKDKMKKDAKKAIMKKIIAVIGIKAAIIIAIVLAATIGIIILLAGFNKIVKKDGGDKTNNAKTNAVTTSYSGNVSTTGTDEEGNTVSKVVITTNDNNTGYKIDYNDDPENIKEIREELDISEPDNEQLQSGEYLTDFELAVLGAFLDNGADLSYYSEEELECFLPFIKAEACTQNLDLRKNTEKFGNKEQIADNYIPQKIADLEENEVPGTILVQRTNTNGNTATILEYKEKTEFEDLVEKDNKDGTKESVNYFTITDDGNLLIAKWDNILITVDGEYPENLEDSEKVAPTKDSGENIITTEQIPYSQYIEKYTMPFEFLIQLLVITEDPEFCMELVDYVLDSRIVINIQEEETVTETNETKNYTIYNKNEKSINYQINAVQQEIVKEDNIGKEDSFLKYSEDDKGEKCTTYNEPPSKLTVKIYTKYTSHSYAFEIIEAETWIAQYKKTYKKKDAVPQDPYDSKTTELGEYKELKKEEIADENKIDSDKDVKKFVEETVKNYKTKIIVPQNVIISTELTDQDGNKYKRLSIKYNNGNIEYYNDCYEKKDEDGKGTGIYKYPDPIIAKTERVPSNDKTKEIPEINYKFELKTINNAFGSATYEYELKTDIDPLVECKVSKLEVKDFEKIDLETDTTITITKHPADPNPLTETIIYAKDKETEEFEKFLLAYDNSEGAQNQINSIDSWLFEMMEENENTVELVDIIKYLLYIYDEEDRGVTKLDLSIFGGSSFSSVGGVYGSTIQEKVWWALKDLGYSDISIAAAMGNIHYESGSFNPNCIEGGYNENNGGIGICQWTNSNRGPTGRNTNLKNFANSKGKTWQDENIQVEFLIGELTPGGGADGYAVFQLMNSDYTGTNYYYKDWTNAKDTEELDVNKLNELTEIFCYTFERPGTKYGKSSMPERQKWALHYYNEFHGKERPQGGGVQPDNGDGYSQVYTSSTGRTYREYKQWMGSYASNIFTEYSPQTVAESGCSITSIAIITSGYSNTQTPGTLSSKTPILADLLNEGGAKSTKGAADAQKLTSGKPALVPISGTLVTERGAKHYGGHFIAILDARNGNEVYVSDPGANDSRCGGWTNVQNIINITNGNILYVNDQ